MWDDDVVEQYNNFGVYITAQVVAETCVTCQDISGKKV